VRSKAYPHHSAITPMSSGANMNYLATAEAVAKILSLIAIPVILAVVG